MDRTDISIKITNIENDLELLKNGHIHELEKVPGAPKCSTLVNHISIYEYDQVKHIWQEREEAWEKGKRGGQESTLKVPYIAKA